MTRLAILLLLIFICSCNNVRQAHKQKAFENNILVGEWRLDSSSNRFFSGDKMIILEDSFYLFSGSDGGSLIAAGKRYGNDSLTTVYNDTWRISVTDTNHFRLEDRHRENFYERVEDDQFRDHVREYLQQDSLRHKIIGWWKSETLRMPINLINYSGYYYKFTLNIRDDGKAIFYLENKLDSIVEYSYNTNTDGIDFNRGCIAGSDSKISFGSQGQMKLVLDRRAGDTLFLERLTEIE